MATKYDPTITAMLDDAKELYAAQTKVARALAKLPDNAARRRVLRAVAILLGLPDPLPEQSGEAET